MGKKKIGDLGITGGLSHDSEQTASGICGTGDRVVDRGIRTQSGAYKVDPGDVEDMLSSGSMDGRNGVRRYPSRMKGE